MNSRASHRSINPATLELIEEYPLQSNDEIADILTRAHNARREWQEMDFSERGICFQLLAQHLRENEEQCARMMSLEMGKPILQARSEVQKCASTAEYYAIEAASLLAPEPIRSLAGNSAVHFSPLGVVLAIMPWNFPFWQIIRAAVPTMMAGNCMVVKHSPEVSGCALLLQSLMEKSGLGNGRYQTVLADVEQTQVMIRHPHIDAVTFTGSTTAGRAVASTAGAALKKTVLELGGSDAYCVMDDADVELAARVCASSRLINSGQSCVAAKRFIVMDSIRSAFEELFVHECKSVRVGDPLDERTTIGPLARVDLRDKLQAQVEDSVSRGARVLLQGGSSGIGAFFHPMVLTDVKPGMPAFDEELFGPAAAIISASSQDEVIRLANASRFGLGAAVFSRDAQRAESIALSLEAGCCFVNDLVRSDARFPFGGVKESGWGRELSAFGIREFVNIRSVVIA